MPQANLAKNVLSYLNTQLTCVVASVAPNGQPQAATVFFWVNDVKGDKFKLFFVTRRHTRKFNNIIAEPRVAMVVGTAFEPTTVQIDGEATLLDMATGIKNLRGFRKMMDKHSIQARIYDGAFYPKSPFKALDGEDYAIFRVVPKSVTLMNYDTKKKEITYTKVV